MEDQMTTDQKTSLELVEVHSYLEATGDITGVEERLAGIVKAGHYAELRSAAGAMRKFIKLVSVWEREHIAAHGPIQSHGKTYGLRTETVAEVDTKAAWPVLREWLGEAMTGCVKVSLPAAKKLARDVTKRGEKKLVERGIELALQDVGAITWRERQKITEIREEASGDDREEETS